MKRHPIGSHRWKHSGFTLVELLVVIAVIGILAALLFPVFAHVREKARQSVCLSNERQLGLALFMYAHDNDGDLPQSGWGWAGDIYPYAKNVGVFRCPSDETDAQPPLYPISYGLNDNVGPLAVAGSPAKVVLLFEVVHSQALVATPGEGLKDAVAPRYVSARGIGDGITASGPFLRNDTRVDSDDPVRYATGAMVGGEASTSPEGGVGDDALAYQGGGRHQGGADFLLADGHAQWLLPRRVSTGGDAPTPEAEPWYASGHYRAAGSENARYSATFSTR